MLFAFAKGRLLLLKPRAAGLRRGAWGLLALLGSLPLAAQTESGSCGNVFVNSFGPYDYRVEQGEKRKIVETNHFTWNVESLLRGNTGSLGGEIAYTLRAFPNHHRALVAMMNLGSKLKTAQPPGAGVSVECFFTRAVTFRPDDVVARMLYAKYLTAGARKADALKQLEFADFHAKDNGFSHYNIGLIYLDLGQHDEALVQAHRALALEFTRPELKDRLQQAGKWKEPDPPVAAASASASAPGSGSASPPASAPDK